MTPVADMSSTHAALAAGAVPLPWLAEPLAQALSRQRAHATLVHGAAGVGQYEFALTLARAWLCEADAGTARPCGVCAGCRQFAAGTHPDFMLLVPEALRETLGVTADGGDGGGAEEGGASGGSSTKRKPSREIRIGDVRAAIGWGSKTAARGGVKVVLIHPATQMNMSAANALLKTLEEPSASLRLVLTTDDPQRLLPTVRSRCQRIALPTPPWEVALAWLRAQGVDQPDVLLRAAGGLPLEAAAMAGDGLSAALWLRLPTLVREGDAQALMGLPVPRLVDALQRIAHDALLVAAGGAPRFGAADWIAPGVQIDEATAWAERLRVTRRHHEHPWQAPLLAEALLLAGRNLWHTPASSASARSTPVAKLRPR